MKFANLTTSALVVSSIILSSEIAVAQTDIIYSYIGAAMSPGLTLGIHKNFVASVAASQNQQIVNGLFHPTENNFFNEGREQFEREIQMLLHQPLSSFDNLLKISPKLLQIQEKRSPDASPTISPRTTEQPAKSNQSKP